MMISIMVVHIKRYESRKFIMLSGPITSIPALQNADIDWKREAHSPFCRPNIGTSFTAHKTVPAASTMNTPLNMEVRKRSIPLRLSTFSESPKSILSQSMNFLLLKSIIMEPTATTPSPPICIKSNIINCPKTLQCA